MPGFAEKRVLQAGPYELILEKEADDFSVAFSLEQDSDGLLVVSLKLGTDQLAKPGLYRLSWLVPMVDIQAFWRPGTDRSQMYPADWSRPWVSQSMNNAPTGCLYNLKGLNRHTWAFSDALNSIEIVTGVREETAEFLCSLTLFQGWAPFKEYEAFLRIDTRTAPYFETLAGVAKWWAAQPGYTPAPVPGPAREPMYSTWYSFHQQLVAAEVEEQCRLARPLGCTAVIVDDGWQTDNNDRGYAYCGDWEVFGGKIPDMAAHVANIHRLGMKYLLWYALPFVGEHSRAFRQFQGKFLYHSQGLSTWVLDPRFPDVREYLINLCERAVREWGLDGFKLDFVNDFRQSPDEDLLAEGAQGERDYISVAQATDRLLSDVIDRLRQLNPEILIEFRQPYIGPLMRKYGNMFRAGDCPNDSLSNRVRTLDVRLLGNAAPHSDMVMWHGDEPVESAALQIVNVLFAVPQVSVRLDRLPPAHHRMVEFWLSFWTRNRGLLLDGDLKPWHPEAWFPLVEVSNEREQLAAVYANTVVELGDPLKEKLTVVNGTLEGRVILDLAEDAGPCKVQILDCQGQVVIEDERNLAAGLTALEISPAGLAIFERKSYAGT